MSKLTIEYELGKKSADGKSSDTIEAHFNPTQLSYTRTATWDQVDSAAVSKTAPKGSVRFRAAPLDSLTVSLFFDTYAPYDAASSGGVLSAAAPAPASVSVITGKVMNLAKLDPDLHRPPLCKVSWGKLSVFNGVLQSATRTYILFLEDGTPVRATMECTFTEHPGTATAAGELHSADVEKRYVVRPGDTLMSIAAVLYGSVASWRLIAHANDIEDPRVLPPGKTLTIPRIR
jgi:nucleoid-associated protein YgaU